MKITTHGLIVSIVLAFSTAQASAADRDFRYDRSAREHGSWRLGERLHRGFAIYRQQGRRWYRVPGEARAVGQGWVIGTKRENGGFAIYRWNGYSWDQAPGGAVRIGGSYQRPWVVNNRGQRYLWNGYDWNPDFAVRQPRYDQYNRDERRRERFGKSRHDRRGFESRRHSRDPDIFSRGQRRGRW